MRRAAVAIFVTVFFATTASTAVAAHAKKWTWTESYAEKRVKATFVYTDRQKLAAWQAEIAALNQEIIETRASGGDVKYLQQQRNVLRDAGCGCRYRPIDVFCIGRGPSSDGFRFGYFRCSVQFPAGRSRVMIHVTGRTTYSRS